MCFKWILEQPAIISSRHYQLDGFITVTESVYCAVGFLCLSVIQVDLCDCCAKNATSHRLYFYHLQMGRSNENPIALGSVRKM